RPTAFFDFALAYGPDHVDLLVSKLDFGDVARSANEKAVAGILDQWGLGRPETDALFTARTKEEARRWMNQLTGEVYTTYPVAVATGMSRFVQAVTSGLDHPAAQEARSGWVTAYASTGNLHADRDLADATLQLVGGVAGIDVYSGPQGRVGFTAGFAHNTVKMDERNSQLTGDGYQLGVYGR